MYLKSEGELRLPLAGLYPMQMHLYAIRDGERIVKFLVERTRDQIVHVALASCSACARQRSANYAKDGQMICGRCKGAMPFARSGQKTTAHTCQLIAIPHREAEGDLIVSISAVIQTSRQFLR